VAVVRGEGDDLLIKEEKAPNASGARAVGFDDAEAVALSLREGAVKALVILGHDLLDPRYLGGVEALADLDAVILLDLRQSELVKVATVSFPTRHPAERDGSLTNHAGRVQRVWPAVEPSFEAHAEGLVLARLGRALDLDGFDGSFDPGAVSRAMAAELPAFAGASLDRLPEGGRPLAGTPEANA
jgi:NADH-quinone oxidoreductase subunit G